MIDNFALFVTHLALVILGVRLLFWGDPEDGGSTIYAPPAAATDRDGTVVRAAPRTRLPRRFSRTAARASMKDAG